jgi:biotin synthase
LSRVIEIIDKLEKSRCLSPGEYTVLLSSSLTAAEEELLRARARAAADAVFGRKVKLRGLLEVTNVCRNNCLYCGLRRDNRQLRRYTLSHDVILDCCRSGYRAGFRTFVLQGGENPAYTAESVASLVGRIKSEFPDAAVTLSLGEWPDEAYHLFREAGADRYLLRHETHNGEHYSHLHPQEMSLANRLRCLDTLKRLGYETGTGIMVGSPYQRVAHIVEDLEYMHRLQPDMIGIGPFIPHSATPFASMRPGTIRLTTRLISILRLMFPHANIPSTTALATLEGEGRNRGLLAGANVVMPNISPVEIRGCYSLYDNKAASGAEAVEGLRLLAEEIGREGFEF